MSATPHCDAFYANDDYNHKVKLYIDLFQWWFLLGNHNHRASPHVHQQHIVSIWLDKGWGNPDRNAVAKTIERLRAGHLTCKNTDWEKWREPIRKVEPETTDWALHTRIPVRIEPSHFLTAAECWSIAGSEDTQSGELLLLRFFFFSFFPFVSGRRPNLGVLPRLQTCFQFIYLFSSPAMPPSSSSSSSSSLSRASSWKDSSPPSRLFASK